MYIHLQIQLVLLSKRGLGSVVVKALRYKKVPGSIPGVVRDFSRGI